MAPVRILLSSQMTESTGDAARKDFLLLPEAVAVEALSYTGIQAVKVLPGGCRGRLYGLNTALKPLVPAAITLPGQGLLSLGALAGRRIMGIRVPGLVCAGPELGGLPC